MKIGAYISIVTILAGFTGSPILATTLTIDATANIFGAGSTDSTPPAYQGDPGIFPPSYSFTAGAGQVLSFSSVTGEATLTTSLNVLNGPDGNTTDNTDIYSYGGISGITNDQAFGFLVGVFLTDSAPTSAPGVLNFSSGAIGTDFLTISPEIGQTFFIGDGVSTGGIQQFMVPSNATRLFLGVADANGYVGLPGMYQDNSGSYVATFTVAAVPEPATYGFLMAVGILPFVSTRRRFRKA